MLVEVMLVVILSLFACSCHFIYMIYIFEYDLYLGIPVLGRILILTSLISYAQIKTILYWDLRKNPDAQ
jgi:hypothetical protein